MEKQLWLTDLIQVNGVKRLQGLEANLLHSKYFNLYHFIWYFRSYKRFQLHQNASKVCTVHHSRTPVPQENVDVVETHHAPNKKQILAT